MSKTVEEREHVVVRFAGDSGDGMQLTGDRFTSATALLGNDLATLPDFPAEIRAPAGTVHGVSAFQIQFASTDVATPGDHADVLVAMNPAALKADLGTVGKSGTLILNEDAFTPRNLEKAGYADGSPSDRGTGRVPGLLGAHDVDHGAGGGARRGQQEGGGARQEHVRARARLLDVRAAHRRPPSSGLPESSAASPRSSTRTWRPSTPGTTSVRRPSCSRTRCWSKAAPAEPGIYRNIAGAQALAWGLIAASKASGLTLFYASYPITPASDLLHELSRHKNFGVITVQAEDEIAAANVALGAAFAGQLAVTGTSGPGLDLKTETIGLAVITELPMIVVDVQRAGPSTGLPTKTEQADLLPAMFGRHGESPDPDHRRVLAV